MSDYGLQRIGVIRSPYKEKFAVPRQPGLVPDGTGELHLSAPYNHPDAVRGLELRHQLDHPRVGFALRKHEASELRSRERSRLVEDHRAEVVVQ